MAFGEQHDLPLTCFAFQNRSGLHDTLLFYSTFLAVRPARSGFVMPDNFLAHLPKANM